MKGKPNLRPRFDQHRGRCHHGVDPLLEEGGSQDSAAIALRESDTDKGAGK